MDVRLIVLAAVGCCAAEHYQPPAGNNPATRRPGAQSILPGGRLLTPVGRQYSTGPGPFGLAINPKGDLVVSADGGPNRYALTVLKADKNRWTVDHLTAPKNQEEEEDDDDKDWRSVFQGLAFLGDRDLLASEGNTGRVRHIDPRNGKRKFVYELNQAGFSDSYSGDMAFDAATRRVYVVDQANFRVAIFDTARRTYLGSVRVGRLPFAIALAPGGKRLYVTNLGMFEYTAVPGADPKQARETGLPFPAFGFPSRESQEGTRAATARGEVDIAPLGDPNVAEANSVAVVNVENPAEARVEKFIRTGLPFGNGVHGGSSPSGLVVSGGKVYVSNAHNDTITVINEATLEVEGEMPLRIPGLESLRGVLPIGLFVDEPTGWLLAACAGINALAVIDTKAPKFLGLVPTPWFPTRVVVRDGKVWVAAAKGHGTGPNATRAGRRISGSFLGELRRGSISEFPLPEADTFGRSTAQVLYNNGFLPQKTPPDPLPAAIEHVVIIVKENRTFDEVFGDIETAANGPVRGIPDMARFGTRGIIRQTAGGLQQRLTIRDVNVTPNHHALAKRFAFSDNFYADSEVSVDGHHWIVGSYPNAWTESTLMAAYGGNKNFRLPTTAPGRLLYPGSNSSVHPEEQLEAGALWHHLERHGVSFRNFGEGFELAGINEGEGLKPTGARVLTNVPMPDPLFRNSSRNYPGYNMNIPDQFRATQFIGETKGSPLPRLVFIHLPNDHTAKPRPEDGYPFDSSYVADNDVALGRIVEYLSHRDEWKKMAIFVTEDDAQGGVDHVDSHRTVLLAISPWVRPFYLLRANSSFPGLLKTAFRLLGIPPLNLYDAAAQDFAAMFGDTPDFTPFDALPAAKEIFDPAKAREPLDPVPSPRMDDPAFVREQHRQRQ